MGAGTIALCCDRFYQGHADETIAKITSLHHPLGRVARVFVRIVTDI